MKGKNNINAVRVLERELERQEETVRKTDREKERRCRKGRNR